MKKFRSSGCAAALIAASPLLAFAQASLSLPPATITATRFPDSSQSLPFGVSVITAQEIRRSGATTVNDALMRVLGVAGRADLWGGGEYTIDLRGFGATADSNQVVIVDGIRVSEADLGGTRLAGIPIESVERIEVLRGSAAVLYGEGAVGGVIVVTTQAGAGRTRANGGSVYAATGSHGLRELRANGTVSAGGFSLDASLQKRDSDGYRANSRSETEGGSLTAQWSGEAGRFGARHTQDRLDSRLPGALTTAQFEADPRQTLRPNDFVGIRSESSALFGETQLGNWQLAFDAGQRERELRSVSGGFPYDFDIRAENQSIRARHSGTIAGLRNLFVVGVDHLDWERVLPGPFGSTATQSSRAYYVKDDVTLPGGTRIGLGWRTERARKDSTFAFAPLGAREQAWEVGVSHPFATGLTGFARIARGFRFANVDEFTYTSAGVDLVPQTSRDVEAGVRWTHAQGNLEARVYRSTFRNEIGFDPLAPGPSMAFPGANVNFDPTQRTGLEVDATQRLNASLGVRVNAGWREAKFRSGPYAGRDVPLAPRHTLAVRADWTPAPGHTLSGGVQWVSSQHPDYANACTMPAYTTADLRYAYQWKQAEFSLGVTNLADRTFYTQSYACVAGRPSSIYPEPGRAFTAAVRVTF